MDPLKDWARQQAAERCATARFASPLAASELAAGFARYFGLGRDFALSGYWPAGDEFDVRPLLELLHDRGCRISLPAAAAYGAPVQFRQWVPGDALVPGPYGTLQPCEDAAIQAPSMSLLPLLAFDRRCNPLTAGFGLYHRMVSGLQPLHARRAATIGVAFAAQEIDAVPTRVLDQPVDCVATEAGIMRAPPEHSSAAVVLWGMMGLGS
jgi:5-formyltetrahydrofolate cyclo-ligase